MVWTPIARQSLTDEVFQRILQLIDSKELQANAPLPSELELTKVLGVGRSTVREAIAQLVTMGVVSRSRSGTVIAGDVQARLAELRWLSDFREETVDHLYEARIALEASGARYAAIRASADDLAILEEDIRQLAIAVTEKLPNMLAIDLDFHRHLVRASGNPILTSVHAMVIERFLESLPNLSQMMGMGNASLDNHRTVLRHLRQHDADGAAEAVRTTLDGVQNQVRQYVNHVRDGQHDKHL